MEKCANYSRNPDYEFLMAVAKYVQKNYYKDVSTSELMYYAAQGMLSGLDPYSAIYEETESNDENKGVFGISVSYDVCGQFYIEWVEKDSPADEAGLRIGDFIYSVNGVVVEGDFTSTFTRLIGDKKVGDEVVIKIKREGVLSQDIVLTARNLPTNYVRTIYDFSGLEGGEKVRSDVGYIHLTKFSKGAGEQMDLAISEFRSKNKKKLILDLRDNVGGDGSVLTKIASYFLDNDTHEKGIPIINLSYKNGKQSIYKTTEYNYVFRDISGGEIVVLVNGKTASAAEALTGAMLVANTAEIVGETTYGKGIGQSIVDFPNKTDPLFKIKLTVGEYRFSGNVGEYVKGSTGYVDCIHLKGFTPKGENYVEFNRANALLSDNQFLRALECFSD